ncbi:hypothetical protein C8J56DRAFT_888220 [Mycena floridula]|nr:hypothetical protein C8J56DRAFT_888220 [Mycena floridula]
MRLSTLYFTGASLAAFAAAFPIEARGLDDSSNLAVRSESLTIVERDITLTRRKDPPKGSSRGGKMAIAHPCPLCNQVHTSTAIANSCRDAEQRRRLHAENEDSMQHLTDRLLTPGGAHNNAAATDSRIAAIKNAAASNSGGESSRGSKRTTDDRRSSSSSSSSSGSRSSRPPAKKRDKKDDGKK